jgi:cadmium resistance protein CadD (predicted permease)
MNFLQILLKAIISFVIVNIDEFIVLLLFFTKAIAVHHSQKKSRGREEEDDQLTVFQIIAGQIIGFSIIIVISLLGSIFGLLVPYEYIALIGLVPFGLGCYELYRVLKYWTRKCSRKYKLVPVTVTEQPAIELHSPLMDPRYQRHPSQTQLRPIQLPGQLTTSGKPATSTNNASVNPFEQQYEMISTLSLNSHRHSTCDDYPHHQGGGGGGYPRHDYSSYQNPPGHHHDIPDDEEPSPHQHRLVIPSGNNYSDDEDDYKNNPNNAYSATSSDNESEESMKENTLTSYFQFYFDQLLHKNIFYVSMILLSDGSEEIAVFLPILTTVMSQGEGENLLSLSSPHAHQWNVLENVSMVFLIVFIWYCMIFCQCYLAYLLIIFHYESYGKWISRYSKNIIPFILIGLGLIVLQDSVLWKII